MQTSPSPKFLAQGTYSPSDSNNKTTINLTLQSDSVIPAKDKYVLIVLDRTNSMTGPKLEACIKGISQVINTLFDHNPNPKVDLITFNQDSKFYSLQTKSREECLEILSGVKTEGSTVYHRVFGMIEDIINNKAIRDYDLSKITRKDKAYFAKNRVPQAKINELAVLFITAKEGKNIELVMNHASKFKEQIQSKIPSVEFYTLVLGTPESAQKLEGLMKGLSGNFQYIQKAEEIVASIEDISGAEIKFLIGSDAPIDKQNNLQLHKWNVLQQKLSSIRLLIRLVIHLISRVFILMSNYLQKLTSKTPLKLTLLFIEVIYFAINLSFAPFNHYHSLTTRFLFSVISCLLSDFQRVKPSKLKQDSSGKQFLLIGLKILSLVHQVRTFEQIDWLNSTSMDQEALILDLAFEGLLRLFTVNLLVTTFLVKCIHSLSSLHVFSILMISEKVSRNLIIRVAVQGLLFCLMPFILQKSKEKDTEKSNQLEKDNKIMINIIDHMCEGAVLLDEKREIKYVNNHLRRAFNYDDVNNFTLQELSNKFSSFELNDLLPNNNNLDRSPSLKQIKLTKNPSFSKLSPLYNKISYHLNSNTFHSLLDIFDFYMKSSSTSSENITARSGKFRPTFRARFQRDIFHESKFVELDVCVIQEKSNEKYLLILVKDTEQTDFKNLLIEKEKTIYQENFVSSLSHELRTPLNSNLAFLELAMDSHLIHTDAKEKLIKPAFASAKLLFYIVSDVLDYSMILANTLKRDIRSKSLISTVKECFDIFQAKAKEKDIKLNLIIQGEISSEFYTDHKRVSQVLVNLLKNSFRFTTKGTIEVILEKSSNQNTLITVRDTGIGIARTTQERLHDSLSTEKLKDKIHENSAGIGFGLYISNKLAKLLNDEYHGLDFSSELDNGSKFFFEVQNFALQTQNQLYSPLRKYQCEKEEFNLAENIFRYTTRRIKNSFSHQPRSRVLVVDDEVFNIIVIENFCKSLGISVEKALNGEEAISKLKTCSKDDQLPLRAIFMDINMPIKDGYQATKEIQQMINKREIERIPIIGVTAYGSKEKVERGYKSGMVEVLIKPLSKEMIVEALSQYKVI